ncbi:MBL fold metallo-hydrolase [Rhodococcus sp. BH2-1]|nr:MBL fold metallo-hydrolase [Rhodococcus sp. BH2-1]
MSDAHRGWFDLGDAAVVPLVEDDRLLIDPAEFFPDLVIDPDAWYSQPPWFDSETGKLILVIQSFLICVGEEIHLVDACVGAGKSRKRQQFNNLPDIWMEQFLATGIRPEDAASVVFTHLHTDHVGAVTRRRGSDWEPVFPHAPHYVVEAEYNYWASSDGEKSMHRTGDYVDDSIRPIEQIGQLRFTDGSTFIGKQIELVPAFGHTPGNICVRIHGRNGMLTIAGDTMHHPVQIYHPELSTQYCYSSTNAQHVREQLLTEASENGSIIVPSHFPLPSAGRVIAENAGYSFQFATDIVREDQFHYETWLNTVS